MGGVAADNRNRCAQQPLMIDIIHVKKGREVKPGIFAYSIYREGVVVSFKNESGQPLLECPAGT